MAIVELCWKPENKEFYQNVEYKTEIPDDADIYEQFELWKKMMNLLGYSIQNFDLVDVDDLKPKVILDNPRPAEYDNYSTGTPLPKDGVIITSKSK